MKVIRPKSWCELLVFFHNFDLASSTELIPLFVCAKEPVPPSEGAGVVPIEVVVMEIMESGTCERRSGGSDQNAVVFVLIYFKFTTCHWTSLHYEQVAIIHIVPCPGL